MRKRLLSAQPKIQVCAAAWRCPHEQQLRFSAHCAYICAHVQKKRQSTPAALYGKSGVCVRRVVPSSGCVCLSFVLHTLNCSFVLLGTTAPVFYPVRRCLVRADVPKADHPFFHMPFQWLASGLAVLSLQRHYSASQNKCQALFSIAFFTIF